MHHRLPSQRATVALMYFLLEFDLPELMISKLRVVSVAVEITIILRLQIHNIPSTCIYYSYSL